MTEQPNAAAYEAPLRRAVDTLDKVSRRLSRAGGMAIAAGLTEVVDLIGESGCDVDDVLNDLLELVPDA